MQSRRAKIASQNVNKKPPVCIVSEENLDINFRIKVINIQGLTKVKVHEIEDMMKDQKSIICLTETQQKYEKIQFTKGIMKKESMREKDDKKGGGITILYPEKDLLELEVVSSQSRDILDVKGKFLKGKIDIRIIAVYFSVQNNQEDKKRNIIMKKELQRKVENAKDELLIVLGDFNGHTGILGQQKLDNNGQTVIDLITNYDLTLLNADESCTGVYTWRKKEQKSAIDFVVVNNKFYNYFVNMYIDEQKEMFDLSDHNLITVNFAMKHEKTRFQKNKWITSEYYKTDEASLEKFCAKLEENITKTKINNIEEMDETIKSTAEKELKKKIKRKVCTKNKEIKEPLWITQEIRDAIKKRRFYNRKKRNCKCTLEKEQLGILYIDQKKKAAKLVKDAITKHEQKKCDEIRQGGNKSKKLWENIDSLKGKEIKSKEAILYNEEGTKLESEEAKEKLLEFWGQIYGKHENKIEEEWNEEIAKKYQQEIEKDDFREEKGYPISLREHMDAAMESRNMITPMKYPDFTNRKVKEKLRKLKNRKAAGPSGLKPELYKAMNNSETFLKTITNCFRKELKRKNKPPSWKTSNTKMIPKKSRPTVKDLRPIALTEVSYKLFMSLIKDEIEEHLWNNNEMKEVQAGFTKGGKTEDNIFILQYCIERSFKMKKPLIITSIDFSKAFDSIKREKIITALKKYKVHPEVIETIANIYQGDSTTVKINEDIEKEIPVSSGIKQGCTGSTVLFKLITYMIIQEIEKERQGFRDDKFNIGLLFFADDGLILSQSLEEAKEDIKQVVRLSAKYGLDINKDKSNIIAVNLRELPDSIGDIKVVETIKYLGLKINAGRDLFRIHKKEMMEKAQRLANTTYSIIAKSCNRMMIGKTYWKSLALPSFLYGSGLMNLTEKEIGKLQVIENSVYRHILGAPGYAASATLRGEVGASSMKARIIKERIMYVKGITEGRNDLLKEVLRKMMENNESKWMKTTKKYANEIGIKMEEVKLMKKYDIEKRINIWDTKKWKEEMERKTSLNIYRAEKQNIGQKDETIYDNTIASTLLYKARSNTLQLNDRKRFIEESTNCPLCNEEYEDMTHFILVCQELSEVRRKNILLQYPMEKETDKTIGKLLFADNIDSIITNKETLYELWKHRKRKIDIAQNNQ